MLSIDYSLRSTGCFYYSMKEEGSFCINFRQQIPAHKCVRNIHERIESFISDKKIELVLIEDYRYNVSGTKSITRMAEVKGAILSAIDWPDVSVINIPIATWKSISAKGWSELKDNKQEYLKKIKEVYGRVFDTVDEADAFLMYVAMLKIKNGYTPTPAAERLLKDLAEVKVLKLFER